MTRLYSLEISHYRGFEHFLATFDLKAPLTLLCGRGDSGKSTLLKAISCVLSPQWNLPFHDWDFTACNVEQPIEITAVIANPPEKLLTEQKFGLFTGYIDLNSSDPQPRYDEALLSAPEDDLSKLIPVLTVRLRVNADLEPHWQVLGGDGLAQEKEIGSADRALFAMYSIEDLIDTHFTCSRRSPLSTFFRGSDDAGSATERITQMVRDAYAALNQQNAFHDFDKALQPVLDTSHQLGVSASDLQALLENQGNAWSESNLSLHTSKLPWRLRGKGSRRLLSLAIQQQLVKEGGIVLIDELEQGLECDRIMNLVRNLKTSTTTTAQYLVTTHSIEAVTEAGVSCVLVLSASKAENTCTLHAFDEVQQSVLRSCPEAVFARRLICCEGRTELGMMRALDRYLIEHNKPGLASRGIVPIDCEGGDKFYKAALAFRAAGLDVCLFHDDDLIGQKPSEAKKKATADISIKDISCAQGLSIEQQLFDDLPWEAVVELIEYARSIPQLLADQSIAPFNLTAESLATIKDEKARQAVRAAAGNLSKQNKPGKNDNKDHGWFKTIGDGEELMRIVLEHRKEIKGSNCHLLTMFADLCSWIKNTQESAEPCHD